MKIYVQEDSKNPNCFMISFNGNHYPCQIGKNGLTSENYKTEGDLCTPIGEFPLRQVFYNPSRIKKPITSCSLLALQPFYVWCDDKTSLYYNQLIDIRKFPHFQYSHELLWREDNAYNLGIVIGYNDAPPMPNKGSAIFIHLPHSDHRPTAGCIALEYSHLIKLIETLEFKNYIHIQGS